MNIESLGEETVELLFENGLIGNIADLYDLRIEQIASLPRLGDKSARNILQSIASSREVAFNRVLFALGIRFVGETTAKYLAAHFGSMEAIMQASREELLEAEEVGGKIADSIIDYFADEQNREIVQRLQRAGLQFVAAKQEKASNALEGENIVISGSFEQYSRDELKALIEAHGGKNLAAVSANTTLLLAGAKIGPAKLQKAQKLGIRIISEQEFIQLIDGNVAIAEPEPEIESITPQQPIQGSLF